MLFERDRRRQSAESRRIHALFEIAYTIVDFGAALSFVVGSWLFFYDEWQHAATWLFVVGSVLFALKPTIRLWREIKLAARGDVETLAEREED